MFTPSGLSALQSAMIEADEKFPNKKFVIKHVLGDNNLFAVHSHLILNEGDPGLVTMHLFRFNGDKIVEMWDLSQQILPDSPNKDGAF